MVTVIVVMAMAVVMVMAKAMLQSIQFEMCVWLRYFDIPLWSGLLFWLRLMFRCGAWSDLLARLKGFLHL